MNSWLRMAFKIQIYGRDFAETLNPEQEEVTRSSQLFPLKGDPLRFFVDLLFFHLFSQQPHLEDPGKMLLCFLL